jgi:hypothetical protein
MIRQANRNERSWISKGTAILALGASSAPATNCPRSRVHSVFGDRMTVVYFHILRGLSVR